MLEISLAPGKHRAQPKLSLPCSLAGPSTSPGKTPHVLLARVARVFFLVQRATGKKATGSEPGVAVCAKAGPEPSKSAFGEQSCWESILQSAGGERALLQSREAQTK